MSQIIEDLCPQPEDIIITKTKISCFYKTRLEEELE
ncbi:isochorismatase family protein [bacterium]|nr:isochorismatase family protein [bacterium]